MHREQLVSKKIDCVMSLLSANNYIEIQPFTSPCGELLLGAYREQLCLCDWVKQKHGQRNLHALQARFAASIEQRSSDILTRAANQLTAYFAGERTAFDIPITYGIGTDFQQLVWSELRTIPYAATISYSRLALRIGRPDAVRAVANAVGANAISIFVPCHRVVGKNGTLTGYAGGLSAKQYLLQLEQNNTFNQ